MNKNITVVISNYAPRGEFLLNNLINQLINLVDQIIVVINDDYCNKIQIKVSKKITRLKRPNTGMNIGGWNDAIDFCQNSDYVIFLQDECKLIRSDFVENYKSILSQSNIGMVGESINPKWDCEWSEIEKSKLNYKIKLSNGEIKTRVTYYLECMKNWGVKPGTHSTHLRALVWGFNKIGLETLGGFPIGINKEECIAAEIAVSRKVIQNGMEFRQSSFNSFSFFEHDEWQKGGFSKNYK
jgi:hypothetical protein